MNPKNFWFLVLLVVSGCAWRALPMRASAPAPVALTAVPAPPPPAPSAELPVGAQEDDARADAEAVAAADAREDEAEAEDEDDEGVEEEGESTDASPGAIDEARYTAEIDDAKLGELWKNEPQELGSVAIGFAHDGRLLNGERVPNGQGWVVVSPDRAYGTRETIQYIVAAASTVHAQFPDAPPLRVNQLSLPDGGYMRPHKSHQNGRDVDFGFYYPTAHPIMVRAREKVIDPRLNWALVKALVTLTDVQVILVDRRVQAVLYKHALAAGEDKAWLESLFHAGKDSILQHARRHRDHFHVRFFNARAQELGRRIAPLLPQRAEFRVAKHRVRTGDTLSHIAVRYGSSVTAIRKANGLRTSFLRVAQVLQVPTRGACTRCPVPPPVILPPRRLPPTVIASDNLASAETAAAR
ncbi:MAG TPA: penicillin-insensitive murein endopeptidase [Myxococcaceae bacterium]|nr:penicillin-insensitive murein endopeptidase [Myxococcaceae bacterium]